MRPSIAARADCAPACVLTSIDASAPRPPPVPSFALAVIAFVVFIAILERFGVPNAILGYLFVFFTLAVYAIIGVMSRTAQVSEYYVAGRRVPAFYNGMATGADWMSAASFIGMAGTLYLTGYGGLAFIMGWTGGYCLVALFLAPYLRKFGQFTIPDFLGARYGGRSAATSDNARLDAELLMAHALGVSRSDMLLQHTQGAAPAGFAALVERRSAHEPVAYIVGRQEFLGLEFAVTRDTLIPRSDSETVVAAALELAGATGRVLDLGTGSGALLLAFLAARPRWRGIGIERILEGLLDRFAAGEVPVPYAKVLTDLAVPLKQAVVGDKAFGGLLD